MIKFNNSKIILAQPRGFCAGVERAIKIVKHVLKEFHAPIYVHHEIVHNTHVIKNLQNQGVIFIEKLSDIPEKNVVIFSAHGVSKAIKAEALTRNLIIFDATCPLVTKVHLEIIKMHNQGLEIIMIGHKGHPEVHGTIGQVNAKIHLVENISDVKKLQVKNKNMLAYVSQTTLSVSDTENIIFELKNKFPKIIGPKTSDICYATFNRQTAVKMLATQVELIIIVGSKNSSNSNRLLEVAQKNGILAYMIDCATQIQSEWLKEKQNIGITASASAPEFIVQEVVNKLKEYGLKSVEVLNGIQEHTTFPMFPINKNLTTTLKSTLKDY